MDKWVIAIFPLVGVVFGAALQFWLSRSAEREKHAAGCKRLKEIAGTCVMDREYAWLERDWRCA
jgi:hypothetical protein